MTLTVIVGPMFSGKTKALSACYDRASLERKRIVAVTHPLNTRIARTDGRFQRADCDQLVSLCTGYADGTADEINHYRQRTADVLLIDEAQFYPETLVDALQPLLRLGIDVTAGGLDRDCFNQPWGSTARLMAYADRVEKLSSVCASCYAPGTHTQRLDRAATRVFVGNDSSYTAACRFCWYYPDSEKSLVTSV